MGFIVSPDCRRFIGGWSVVIFSIFFVSFWDFAESPFLERKG
jgi:hypothetical protein